MLPKTERQSLSGGLLRKSGALAFFGAENVFALVYEVLGIEIAGGVIALPYLCYQSRSKVIVKGARLESRDGFQVSTCLHYCQLALGSLAFFEYCCGPV